MAEVRNYSLADHVVSILPNSNSIPPLLIGNGDAVESITITYENDTFSFTVSPDGSATLNKNYMKNGTITISLQQTSPFVDYLLDLYNSQMVVGITNVADIVIQDLYGNIDAKFHKCVITKIPDYNAGAESQTRDFNIIYGNGSITK